MREAPRSHKALRCQREEICKVMAPPEGSQEGPKEVGVSSALVAISKTEIGELGTL